METPLERWPARSGQSLYVGIAAVVLIGGWLIFIRVESNKEAAEMRKFCSLMAEAFDAGDNVALATSRTNQARRLIAPGRDPLETSPDAAQAADWWHLRHGDGSRHGEEEDDREINDLPPTGPPTKSISGDAMAKERDIRSGCARAAER